MRRLYGSPCCGPAAKRRVTLGGQSPANRRAFRNESGAPQRIRVATAYPTSTAPPRQHVLSVIIVLRDNQKACQGSFSRIAGRLTRSLPLARPEGLPVYVARHPP